MRYLVKAKLKRDKEKDLRKAIENGTLGAGSIAEGEYIRDLQQARQLENGHTCWVEVCFCPEPLQEERPYWEEYFDLLEIKNAHARKKCKDLNGAEPWACTNCDCTERLEARMKEWGDSFMATLQNNSKQSIMSWDTLVDWFLSLGKKYNVNPLAFGGIYVGAIPFFMASVAWIVRNYRRGTSIVVPVVFAGFFFVSAYLYLIVVGRNVPLWVYIFVIGLIAFGAFSTVKKIKIKINEGEKPI